jgi:hypothetical protein
MADNLENAQLRQQQNHIKKFLDVCDREFIPVYEKHRMASCHSPEVLYSLWLSVKYICTAELSGDIVEFGTWRGGGLAVMAEALREFGGTNRLYGFDTFDGYPIPREGEVDIWGNSMLARWIDKNKGDSKWGAVSLDEVHERIAKITNNFMLIKGEVNQFTDFESIGWSGRISYLRLDMNWFDPTFVVLKNCFNKIQSGGGFSAVYGHHSGARDAVNKFLKDKRIALPFQHVNYSNIVCTVP